MAPDTNSCVEVTPAPPAGSGVLVKPWYEEGITNARMQHGCARKKSVGESLVDEKKANHRMFSIPGIRRQSSIAIPTTTRLQQRQSEPRTRSWPERDRPRHEGAIYPILPPR
jgi:hypothetical protein